MSAQLLFQGYIHGAWITLGVQTPDMAPATITDNKDDGGRDVYVTQCFADHATIRRMPGGVDVTQGLLRIIDPQELARAELVKRLEYGEHIEMTVKPDRAPAERRIRYACVITA